MLIIGGLHLLPFWKISFRPESYKANTFLCGSLFVPETGPQIEAIALVPNLISKQAVLTLNC